LSVKAIFFIFAIHNQDTEKLASEFLDVLIYGQAKIDWKSAIIFLIN